MSLRTRAALAASIVLSLSACNPPAAETYVARVPMGAREAPSAPIVSPDTDGAVWAPDARGENRIVYGKPGQALLFALACSLERSTPMLRYTRHAAADAHAKAILALIGNGHVVRLKIDATRTGAKWRWEGSTPAYSPDFEVFTGGRQVEATVPGAGSVILNPSPLPGELVTRCRSLAPPAAPASGPAAVGAVFPVPPGTTGTAEPPPPPAR